MAQVIVILCVSKPNKIRLMIALSRSPLPALPGEYLARSRNSESGLKAGVRSRNSRLVGVQSLITPTPHHGAALSLP